MFGTNNKLSPKLLWIIFLPLVLTACGDRNPILWEEAFMIEGAKWTYPMSLDKDRSGAILVSGYVSKEEKDTAFMVKYATDGTPGWEMLDKEARGFGLIPRDMLVRDGTEAVLVGSTRVGDYDSSNREDTFVSVYSTNGDKKGQRNFNFRKYDTAYAVSEAEEGGLFFVGTSSHNKLDLLIARTDQTGRDILWEKIVGSQEAAESAQDVTTLANGNLALVGFYGGPRPRVEAAIVMILTPEGREVWRKGFMFGRNSSGTKIVALSNGDLLVAGHTKANNHNQFISRINQNGDIVWSKTLRFHDETDSDREFHVSEMMEFQSGEILVTLNGYSRFAMMRVTEAGELVSDFLIQESMLTEGAFNVSLRDAVILKDETLVLVGEFEDEDIENYGRAGYLARIDPRRFAGSRAQLMDVQVSELTPSLFKDDSRAGVRSLRTVAPVGRTRVDYTNGKYTCANGFSDQLDICNKDSWVFINEDACKETLRDICK